MWFSTEAQYFPTHAGEEPTKRAARVERPPLSPTPESQPHLPVFLISLASLSSICYIPNITGLEGQLPSQKGLDIP